MDSVALHLLVYSLLALWVLSRGSRTAERIGRKQRRPHGRLSA